MMNDRGALSKEDGDSIKEYEVMHVENFLIGCLKEDVESNPEEREIVCM